jgi:long-chain acyl-CoA synthetase
MNNDDIMAENTAEALQQKNFDTLVHRILQHANAQGEHIALAYKNETITYATLAETVIRMGEKLERAGIEPGDRVLYSALSRISSVATMLALQSIRATAVPIDRQALPETILQLYKDTEASLLLTDRPSDGTSDYMHCLSQQILFTDAKKADSTLDACDILEKYSMVSLPDPEAIAEILYTSGSTGQPKGVMLSWRALHAIMTNTADSIGFQMEDVLLLALPLHHSFGLRELGAALSQGATVVLQNGFSFPGDLQENLQRYGCTRFAAVPASIELLRNSLGDRFYKIMHPFKSIEVSAGALSLSQRVWLTGILPETEIWNVWGSSETGGALFLNVSAAARSGKDSRMNAAGMPCNGIAAGICREDGVIAADETGSSGTGRLALKGAMLLSGYWGQPELTAATLQDGWCITGDLAECDTEGSIHLFGRADNVINMGGEKIAPQEIETAADQSSLLQECICIGVPDPKGVLGEIPVLFCVPDKEVYTESRLREFLKKILPACRQPKFLIELEELPRRTMGKTDRKELLRLWNISQNPVLQTILMRRSIRHFSDRPIPEELLHMLLRAAIQAPTGHNLQTWRFTVLRTPAAIRELRETIEITVEEKRAAGDRKIQFYGFENPVCLVLISNDRRNPDGCQDASCAAENLFLAAQACDIGSVWINALMTVCDVPRIRCLLDRYEIPSEHIVWCTAALGYPDETAMLPPRPKRRTDVIRFADSAG